MTSIALNIDGPRDSQYILEVAEAFAESVRILNHLTRDHAVLEYPSEVDTLIRYVASASAHLPRLLGQMSGWYAVEQAAGRVRAADGEWAGRPDAAVVAVGVRLGVAEGAAEALREALDDAASVTRDLGAAAGPRDGAQ